jgi:outer membrane receptor protein involved in Fe transport
MPVVLPKRPQSFLSRSPVASAVLLALASPALMAQETSVLGEVIVTAQKRSESLQDVPISSRRARRREDEGTQRPELQGLRAVPAERHDGSPSPGSGSGFNAVYMRGVATGGDGQATTSQPSVGMYLDEQTITTVQGNLDVHLYDIARVEALAGPQGTLYGASSQAGTIRIITNKPDPAAFAAGYSLEANYVDMEEPGYVAEGFVNLPLSDNAALRFVGWSVSDAGWVDNKLATRTYTIDQSTPDDDLVTTNDEFAEKNYNTSDTIGARAALRINLGDNWTVTPNASYQRMDQEGSWGDDLKNVSAGGAHAVAHYRPEFTDDEWWQAGLTIEGSMNGFDVVYSGNYLNRDVDGSFDYSDYSFYYDNLYTTGYFSRLFLDNNGVQNNPDASFTNKDHYTKASH